MVRVYIRSDSCVNTSIERIGVGGGGAATQIPRSKLTLPSVVSLSLAPFCKGKSLQWDVNTKCTKIEAVIYLSREDGLGGAEAQDSQLR